MNAEEFIKQQIESGYDIHFHDGIWWVSNAFFFHRQQPASFFLKIKPKTARPSPFRSLFGYSYMVNPGDHYNDNWSLMVLEKERLKDFSLNSLSSTDRNSVKKGLSAIEVKRIENISAIIDDFRQVVISTALRTRYGKPPQYYSENYAQWRSYIEKIFHLPGREWWGAFCEGKIIAYLYSYLIDDIMFIDTAKSHSDFLNKNPNDALMYKFLEYCRAIPECKEAINSFWTPGNESLNKFKEKFGFRKIEFPVYTHCNIAVRFIKKLVKLLLAARQKAKGSR